MCRCRAYFDGRVAAAAAGRGGGEVLDAHSVHALCAAAAGQLQFLHFGVENGAGLACANDVIP